MIEVLPCHRMTFDIHRIMVVTLKSGPDMVFIETNLPDPFVNNGTLSLSYPVPRGTGQSHAESKYPGVEMVVYHYAVDRTYGVDGSVFRGTSQAREQQHPRHAEQG